LDWTIWSATLASNSADFQAIVHPIFQFPETSIGDGRIRFGCNAVSNKCVPGITSKLRLSTEGDGCASVRTAPSPGTNTAAVVPGDVGRVEVGAKNEALLSGRVPFYLDMRGVRETGAHAERSGVERSAVSFIP
jgi:hypothetical protein